MASSSTTTTTTGGATPDGETMSSFSTLLAVVSLGVSANALNGLVVAILGSLVLRHDIVAASCICLIGAVSAALGGVPHTLLAKRVPDIRRSSFMSSRSASTRDIAAVLIYAPLWGLLAAVVGFGSFWTAEYVATTSGMPGFRDVTLRQVLSTSLAGTLVLAGYCSASLHLVGHAKTFSFFLRNHTPEFLEWAEEMRKEENIEMTRDPEKEARLL